MPKIPAKKPRAAKGKAGAGKAKAKAKAGRASASTKSGAPRVAYEEGKHPRGEHGHWVTTGAGVRRIREGTPEQRSKLAGQVRAARAKVQDPGVHSRLARHVREQRAKRRGEGKPRLTIRGQGRPDFAGRLAEMSISVRRRAYADDQERAIAAAVGGHRLNDYEPADVLVAPRHAPLRGDAIEVKSLIFGAKRNISVHANALVRKVQWAGTHPGDVFHTVAIDKRHESEGGKHAARYSGHEIYYKRACGPYKLSEMYRVKDMDELKRLMAMTDAELPEAARGAFPTGKAFKALVKQAARERKYNNGRSKERKATIGKAAYGR